MKKIALFFLLVIAIIATIAYMYLDYKANYNIAKKENIQLESYYEKEILRFRLNHNNK